MHAVRAEAIAVREFTPDDAAAVDTLWRRAFGGFEDEYPGAPEALVRGPAVLAQTGARLLVAERDGEIIGAVRSWAEDGVAWFGLLVSERPWAGRRLTRAIEGRAQDAGLRLVRVEVPDGSLLEEYFGRLGYLPVRRKTAEGPPIVTLEKRLPLLTVREQRRSDANVIAGLSGEDPWPFEQGSRPGWFVAADGERPVGAVAVRDAGAGSAMVRGPWLDAEYRGRGLELWMAERAATYAETNGYHTISLPAEGLSRLRRDFEDRRWFLEGAGESAAYVRRLDRGAEQP
jgi:predicted N-acetyltransferase YhbS